MFSLQWSNESQAAQENSTRIKLQRVCIYYVRLCSLCLLPDFSSNFSARFVSGQSLSTSSLSLHTHLSSLSPRSSAPCSLNILCPVTHWCQHSFIHSFIHWESIWPPDHNWFHWFISSLLLFSKNHFVLNTLLSLYLSLYHLVHTFPVLHKKTFSFYEKDEDLFLDRTSRMSLLHISISFSKVPFKLKKKSHW